MTPATVLCVLRACITTVNESDFNRVILLVLSDASNINNQSKYELLEIRKLQFTLLVKHITILKLEQSQCKNGIKFTAEFKVSIKGHFIFTISYY